MVRTHGGDHWYIPSLRQPIQQDITIEEVGQSVTDDDIDEFPITAAFFTGSNRNYANQKGKKRHNKEAMYLLSSH